MGELSEFDWKLRTFLKAYPYRRAARAWTELAKPVSECRVALVTSAGLVGPGDPDFDGGAIGGDFSYRTISRDTPLASLRDCHRSQSFDHEPMRADANVAFPLDTLRTLESEGLIGDVAPTHLSFMGSITAPGRLVKRSAPKAADVLVSDDVDVALLVPI